MSSENLKLGRRLLLQSVAVTFAGRARADASPPALLVSHGTPLFAGDFASRIASLRAWGATLPKPKGIVVMTPHVASKKPALGAIGPGFALYDLPAAMKKRIPQGTKYATPTNESLAARVRSLVPMESMDNGGFDHTTWMPLACLFPAADVPVLEIAYPYGPPAEAFALGKKLASLRAEGVMFVASGGVTHNLAAMHAAAVPAWSREFDQWLTERVTARDADALIDFRARAPAVELAHPDDGGHVRAFLFALGAAWNSGATSAKYPVTGFEGALSIRCAEIG